MSRLDHVTDVGRSLTRDLPGSIHPRFWLADLLTRWMPPFSSAYLRGPIYRSLGGVRLGHGVFVMGRLRIIGGTRGHMTNLRVGNGVLISTDVVINPDARVDVGDDVCLGPFCRIYTSTHDMGPTSRRCRPGAINRPVRIGAGAWLALGVTVLPGVTIGEGTVVASGSVVADDLPRNVFAGGVPARVLRQLEPGEPRPA